MVLADSFYYQPVQIISELETTKKELSAKNDALEKRLLTRIIS